MTNLLQPVAKLGRKCCVNGKVENGALNFFFFDSQALSRSESHPTTFYTGSLKI